jgi:transcription-repair coupling factor (superfamily II helicase)
MIDIEKAEGFLQIKNFLSQENKYKNIWESITVSSIPPEFVELVIQKLDNTSFAYCTSYSSEIKSFVDSLFSYDLNELTYGEFVSTLGDYNFSKTEHVTEKGEFSVRGDIIVFWPSIYQFPIKLEFFGDELETAEIFDPSINRRIDDIKNVCIGDEMRLESYKHGITLVNTKKQINKKLIIFDQLTIKSLMNFGFRQPRLFFQRFDLLEDYLKKYSKKEYTIEITTRHKENIPEDLIKYITDDDRLPSGIISDELKYIGLTDREIFGTIFLQSEIGKNSSSSQSRKMLAQFEGEVEIGNYVVHEDHGIGIYQGIVQEDSSRTEKISTNYIKVSYAEGDEILVPLSLVYKITKYIGNDGQEPELTTLGKGTWKTLTKRARASIELMAGDLARHYAKINLSESIKIPHDESEMYKTFVNKFEFKETPDQMRSIHEVLYDLSLEKPMNRILIGDVGFGKTEVIMRAAFKASEAGCQVALLAPTTILVSQHFKRFQERFKDFPFRIEAVSRFNDKYKNKDIIEDVKNGKVDIIIGTHRLLSNDVEFKNLGLIVVDEEQKFGVKQKEKLKKLEYGAHILMTTATPIPRTLSMALSTIQDISTIQTPPPGRKPINVDVSKMDWNKIISAIQNEVGRGGQVFIIQNSIRTIDSTANKIKSLLPNITLTVAHGQMSGEVLEEKMMKFLNKKYDILLSTTIIENGIDIENVNTLIVLKAQNFGLSQLYQLKGRVGRSKTQAFSYFFYDGIDIIEAEEKRNRNDIDEAEEKKVNKEYLKRLKALSESGELGSGFDIATKDLEIRGAGNILGKEQHGNINKIGFGLYMQMLATEMERIKNQMNL